ncbi:unnamed protein product [Rhizophagus irregularis]|nr:unnamed protein product [Rhizophagus irregularis]
MINTMITKTITKVFVASNILFPFIIYNNHHNNNLYKPFFFTPNFHTKFLSLCLLTYREWCLIGILHLWKNPFIKINSKARFKVYSKIITILLSHLDDKTQSFLKVKDSFGIPRRTTFNYPSFIRQIDFVILCNLIHSWLDQNKFSSPINQEIDYNNENSGLLSYDYSKHSDGFQFKIENLIFFEVLFKLIMTKTQGIDTLRIISFEHEFPVSYLYTLINTEKTRRSLSRLKQFKCKGNFLKRDLISLITEISHEISTFSLSLSDDFDQDLRTSQVSKFLKDQKKIKKLNVKPNNLVTPKYIRKVRTKTLLEIKLFEGNLDYMLENLLKCPNLRRICFCDSNLYKSQNLSKVVFPNLLDLEIINCNVFSSDDLSSPIIPFLIHNGKKIMNIRLSSISGNQIGFLLKISKKYCSNLVTLSVDIQDEPELEIFSKVLKSPRNLRKLRVRYWKVDIDVFKEFFENYGTFLNEFECSCTGEESDIRTLVINLVKGMNRNLVYLLIEEVEFQLIHLVKVRLN